MDLDDEGHHGRGKVKNHRRQSGVLGEEGEEMKSSKRKILRVESEETQDYVREAKSTDQEEAEELSFVPSAISVPQKLIFRCDNQCTEKSLSFWQLASVVTREGEESYTTDICQKCYNDSLKAKGEKNTDKMEVERVRGAKGAPWKAFENVGKRTICMRNVGTLLPLKRKSRQEYKASGSWIHRPKNTWSK